jgi:heme-degrading monooxygenase HmoA
MAVDPRQLRALPGVRFGKLLGTAHGPGTGPRSRRGFGPADADLTRYAALTVWDDPAAAAHCDHTPLARSWARIATAQARLDLRTLDGRGLWSGQQPFGRCGPTRTDEGPVLALTRARLRPHKAITFWRAVPPVAAALSDTPGLLATFGIGEAPIGWQGTISVWRSAADLTGFAYRHPEHRAAIARTATERWYAEELFARFAVLDMIGDRTVLGWTEGGTGRQ